MIKLYKDSKISINPDFIKAEDAYTGVIVQAEVVRDETESEEDYIEFRNKAASVDELIETTITNKVIVHHSGDEDVIASFNPNSTVLVSDYATIKEKLAKDLEVGDMLVDSNYYQKFLEKDEDSIAVFVQQVELIEGEFEGYELTLNDSSYTYHGIYIDDMFVKY